METDDELASRKAVEEKMSSALVLTCKRKTCAKQFFKTEGCNHITCPCGMHYCYQCGAALDGTRALCF